MTLLGEKMTMIKWHEYGARRNANNKWQRIQQGRNLESTKFRNFPKSKQISDWQLRKHTKGASRTDPYQRASVTATVKPETL